MPPRKNVFVMRAFIYYFYINLETLKIKITGESIRIHKKVGTGVSFKHTPVS